MSEEAGAGARSPASAFDEVRVGVVARLRVRHVEIEEAIFARVRDATFEVVGGEDAGYVQGLRVAIAAAVEYGLRGIERGADEVDEEIPAALVEQARRAARAGVGLDTVLRRYVAGYAMLADFAIEAAESLALLPERLDRRSALRDVLRVHTSVLERLTAAIAEEYGRELELVDSSPVQREGELVRALLAGAQAEASGELDYDFEGWHLGVIATGTRAPGALRALQARLGCRLLSVPGGEQTVWAWLGGPRELAMADFERALTTRSEHGEDARAGAGWTLAEVSLAAGEPARGIDGWRTTHRQAQEALQVMLRRPRRLTRFADVALLVPWLEDPARAQALIDTYLSPLDGLRHGGQALRQTLQAYFAAGHNMNAAAAAMGVDRSTVRRHVRTIEEKLARPLHTRQAELQVAMRLEELLPTPGEAD
jgi:PucR C-terminal helix-turn-helix domain/GGDEF-like domain